MRVYFLGTGNLPVTVPLKKMSVLCVYYMTRSAKHEQGFYLNETHENNLSGCFTATVNTLEGISIFEFLQMARTLKSQLPGFFPSFEKASLFSEFF